MGKFSSSNVLKKTRLNKRSSGPILYYGFLGGRTPVGRRWQWKKSWGACIPTVFKGNIVYIFFDAVRIWRDHYNGVLHTPQPLSTGIKM